jgi:hypothetical protein
MKKIAVLQKKFRSLQPYLKDGDTVPTNNATWSLNPGNCNLTNYYMQEHFLYLYMYFWTMIPHTVDRTDPEEISNMSFHNASIHSEGNTSHNPEYHK